MISAPEGARYAPCITGASRSPIGCGASALLIVDHGDGYMTLYGHNQSLFKEAGDWVEVGSRLPWSAAVADANRLVCTLASATRVAQSTLPEWCRRPTGSKVG